MTNNIAVFISGNGSNLQALIDFQHQVANCNYNIALVVSDTPTAFGLERAQHAHIPTIVWQRKIHPTKQEFEKFIAKTLHEREISLVVLAGYMRLIGRALLENQIPIINIHPSLLPNFKGLDTHKRALRAYLADKTHNQHGCTIHFVDETLDGGQIIAQSALTIKPEETTDTLQQRVQQLEHWLYPKTIQEFFFNK